MTTTIIQQFSNKELLDFIKSLNKRPDVLNRFLKNHHRNIYDELVARTQFLDDGYFKDKSVPILARMYCPWRKPEWSDDYYIWRCGLEEAKHQCMLTNEVKILRKKDVENLTVEMFP